MGSFAVLALTGYEVIDPVTDFYPEREADVNDYHLRDSLKLSNVREEFISVFWARRSVGELPINGRQFSQLHMQARLADGTQAQRLNARQNLAGGHAIIGRGRGIHLGGSGRSYEPSQEKRNDCKRNRIRGGMRITRLIHG